MEEKDVMEKVEQFRELSDKIATMFDEAHIEVGLVMSVLCYLYAKTAYEQTDLDAGKAILVVTQAVVRGYEEFSDNDEAENEKDEADPELHFANMEKPAWLN